MEVNDELLIKAIKQAIANVALEFDDVTDIDKTEIEKQKILVLKGDKNGRMGRLCYR